MDLSTSTATNVVLILIFLTLAIACWILHKIFKALHQSSTQLGRACEPERWEEILEKRTEINFQMMSEAHRAKLHRFMDSEAALAEVIEQRANTETTTIEQDYVREKWYKRDVVELIKNGWNSNKEWLKEKLVDKINGIVSSALGGDKGGNKR